MPYLDWGASTAPAPSPFLSATTESEADRGFVGKIGSDKASRQIVKTIIDLCANMEIACVAEGVESCSLTAS